MDSPTIRIRYAGWIALLSTVVYFTRTSLASRAVDYIPEYDHDHKNYYLIQIATTAAPVMDSSEALVQPQLHKDQQQALGRLLGLQFESRVGALSNYYLFSVARPQHLQDSRRQFKTSLNMAAIGSCASSPLVARAESLFESVTERMEKRSGQEEEEEEEKVLFGHAEADTLPDPIVERFYEIKRQFPKVAQAAAEEMDMVDDETRLEKRGAEGVQDHERFLEREVMGLMGEIHKQELRQRIKKRAPLPEDPLGPSPQQQQQQPPQLQELRRRRPLTGRGDEDDVQMDEEQLEDTENTEQVSDVDPGNKKEDSSVEEDTEQEGKVEGQEQEEDMENQVGEDQPEDEVASMFGIEDPGFKYQWHLVNDQDCCKDVCYIQSCVHLC